MRTPTLLASLTVLIVLMATGTSQANDIASFKTVFATDVAYSGFGGLRDNGTGTMTLDGVSGPVHEALLYWHGPTNSEDLTANAAVTFNGTAVVGTNIGLSNDNCWGFSNSHAYRADVTSLVGGNGAYVLADFVKEGGGVNVNGASLLVFYRDADGANNRDVVLFDGNDSNIPNTFDADGWNVSLSGINYSSGVASMDLHVSDGQSFPDDALVLNGTELVPAGPVFDGDTVPGNPAGDRSGLLWDIRSFDVTSFLSPGPNTLTLTTGQNSDCLSLIVAGINLPAGAAPDQPPPPPAEASEAADLFVGQTAERSGRDLVYTITVRNDGPQGATGVTLVDDLPQGVVLRSVSTSQGNCTGTTQVTCSLGDLAVGASATVRIAVRAQRSGTFTNVARVSGNQPDPDQTNNSSRQDNTINPPAARRDSTAPRIAVAGVGGSCVRAAFSARFRIREPRLRRVTVFLDGRRVRRTGRTAFRVRIDARRMRSGRHFLRAVAVDRAGNRRVARRTFTRCARPAQVPTFTG